jgi:uncharacterized GH25 family protein
VKKTILLLGIIVISIIAPAHEFWLSPQKFFYSIREMANIRFLLGEGFKGDNWSGNREKIEQLVYYTPSGKMVDISDKVSLNKGDSLQLPLQESGTHMIIFNSKNSFISLDATKFNAYLQEDGLDNAIRYRKENHQENQKSTEHYQRSIKTLLQISEKSTDACTKPTSLPLDIIPEINPYAIPILDSKKGPVKVRFRILFKGQPLVNTLVKIWYRLPGKIPRMDTFRTDKKGRITAERHPGPYMVSCVYMERTTGNEEAEWQSYWGSLSFEYSQFFRQGR